jgi:hypothetical protein
VIPARLRDLSAPVRLAAFAAGLAVLGGVAALVGAATGGGRVVAADAHAQEAGSHQMGMSPAAVSRANGLAASAAGYTFVPERTTLPAGASTSFRFRIVDAHGHAQRAFDLDGGVRMHLIVVRRDFVGYQHLHPALGPDGTWSVPLTLAAAGAYRAFADFEVDGKKTVLGRDLFAPGDFAPAPLPAVASTQRVDGYSVALTHDELRAGKATELRFHVTRGGKAVPRFDTYVGQRGHLVALRAGDVSYLHVHPLAQGGAGEILFHIELPAAGSYRVFLQFKRNGVVHTAPFTLAVSR